MNVKGGKSQAVYTESSRHGAVLLFKVPDLCEYLLPVSNAFHESLPGIIGLVDVVEVEDLRVPKDIQLARNYELLKPRGEYTS